MATKTNIIKRGIHMACLCTMQNQWRNIGTFVSGLRVGFEAMGYQSIGNQYGAIPAHLNPGLGQVLDQPNNQRRWTKLFAD